VHFIALAFLTNLMCRCVLIDKTGVTTTAVFVFGASYADGNQNIAILAIFGFFY